MGAEEIWKAKYDVLCSAFKNEEINSAQFAVKLVEDLGFRVRDVEREIWIHHPPRRIA